MPSKRQGAIHLFQMAGIDVFLHWSWFLVAAVEIGYLRDRYTSLVWSALEYLALFLIVLLHEFGHALACRQVGGKANLIVLWPLGGVAYVDPPPRPGAMLWSLAAGPLVNVALLPLLGGTYLAANSFGWANSMPDALLWLSWVSRINFGLLIFNLLPIYPLDGGQILWALLWFVLGRARSLQVATVVGFIGGACFVAYGIHIQSGWYFALSPYMLMNCWNGWKVSRALIQMEKMSRREGFACPACRAKPPLGERWRCAQCRQPFDTFATLAVCPHCGAQFPVTTCMDCHQSRPMSEWASAGAYTGATAPTSAPVVPQ